jgi:hypothetical protein
MVFSIRHNIKLRNDYIWMLSVNVRFVIRYNMFLYIADNKMFLTKFIIHHKMFILNNQRFIKQYKYYNDTLLLFLSIFKILMENMSIVDHSTLNNISDKFIYLC